MATDRPMDIPRDEEFPYFVIEIRDGRHVGSTGPYQSFEEALADIEHRPSGEYAITELGIVVWPQGNGTPYN
jgi:hypothetical protein